MRRLAFLALGVLLIASSASTARAACTSCIGPDPSFAYNDLDNDGCYNGLIDSASINAALLAGLFTAPIGTSIVVPQSVKLRPASGVAVNWTALNITVRGQVTTLNADLELHGLAGTINVCDKGDLIAGNNLTVAADLGVDLGERVNLRAREGAMSVATLVAGDVTVGLKTTLLARTDIDVSAVDTLFIADKANIDADDPGVVTLSTTLSTIALGEKVTLRGAGVVVAAGSTLTTERMLRVITAGVTSLTSNAGLINLGARAKLRSDAGLAMTALGDITVGLKGKLLFDGGTFDVVTTTGGLTIQKATRLKDGTICDLDVAGPMIVNLRTRLECDTSYAFTSPSPITLMRTKVFGPSGSVTSTASDVSLSDNVFKGDDTGAVAVSGVNCILTDNKFKKIALDSSGCGSVVP